MERKSGSALKWTMGLAGAALFVASVLPAAHGGGRARQTIDGAARALVYGQADATWTRNAAALAAEDGAAAHALGRLAEAGNLDGVARGRAIEALADAASPAAQEAMRHALSSPTVRAEPAYPMLVARLAGVEAPTLETLLYLAQLRDAATRAGQSELAEAAAPVCHRLHQARTPLSHKR